MTEEKFKATPPTAAGPQANVRPFKGCWTPTGRLRLEVGPFKYITRHMLKDAYGSTHTGTASKFQGHIEEIEDDQPPRGHRADTGRQPDSSEPAPLVIQTAFDGVRKAVEGALNSVLELRAKEGLELADRYQRLQREYLASADAREQALAERIADLEKASRGPARSRGTDERKQSAAREAGLLAKIGAPAEPTSQGERG